MVAPEPAPAPAAKPGLRERLQTLLSEYGPFAVWVYFGIFALVLAGFGLAFQFGARAESAAGVAGTWGAAYLATKATQPLRIAATFALTPILVRLLRRKKQGKDGG